MPSMGGKEESEKFTGVYNQTLNYYQALFGVMPIQAIWEPTDERFSPDVFGCSNVNL